MSITLINEHAPVKFASNKTFKISTSCFFLALPDLPSVCSWRSGMTCRKVSGSTLTAVANNIMGPQGPRETDLRALNGL